jgi:hypothetical protein
VYLTSEGPRLFLCTACKTLQKKQGLRRRERWEKLEVMKRTGGQKCKGCDRVLKKGGVRWWACKACWKECRCDLHPDFDDGSHDR